METNSRALRIALIMDKGIYRESLARVINSESPHTVVAAVGDGHEYEEACTTTAPDIVLIDLGRRPAEGVARIAWVVSRQAGTLPVACGAELDEEWVRRALEAGSRGYVATTGSMQELLAALDELGATGDHTSALVRKLRASIAAANRGREKVIAAITRREMQILLHLCSAAGQGNKQIAADLGISARTVEWHRGNLMGKLGVHDTMGLLQTALRFNLVRIT